VVFLARIGPAAPSSAHRMSPRSEDLLPTDRSVATCAARARRHWVYCTTSAQTKRRALRCASRAAWAEAVPVKGLGSEPNRGPSAIVALSGPHAQQRSAAGRRGCRVTPRCRSARWWRRFHPVTKRRCRSDAVVGVRRSDGDVMIRIPASDPGGDLREGAQAGP
jgi:hypothetical protein